MSYKRTTVSLSPEIISTAKRLMKLRKFAGFSSFIAQLIRDDWDRSGLTEAPNDGLLDGGGVNRKRSGRAPRKHPKPQ